VVLRVKGPQDFGAGVILVAIGLAGIYFGWDLARGTAARMGPGYFPMLLSVFILGLGLAIGARGLTLDGPALEATRLRPILFIVGAILAFGYLIDYIGLALVAVILTLLAAYARPDAKLGENLLLGIGIALFSVAVFVYALGQALPPWWGR
jgi:hypothetical protein